MEAEGGDEADDSIRHTRGDRDEVRCLQRWQVGQAIHPSAHLLQPPCVAQEVERTGMNAQVEGLRTTEYPAMVAEEILRINSLLIRDVHSGRMDKKRTAYY